MSYRDLVKQAATVNGTGAFTLGAAVSGEFQTMHIGRSIGEEIEYTFVKDAQSETGIGTLIGTNTLARITVVSSSNGGALVPFTAGTGEIRETVTSKSLNSFASVRDIPFSATIPLSRPGSAYMAASTVNGPLTFTAAAGAVRGALAYLRLTADGVNVPNFSAFKEWGGSPGYDNRNGIVNQLQFFYDGADLFYSASQAVGAVPNATAVTMTGPTGGVANAASGNFVVGTNAARTAAVIVTPTPVAGVTFNPSSVTLPIGSATASFTATPTTTGAKTIAVTNNASLSNPASITYTVTAAATAPGAPTIGTATAGDGYMDVAFSAPASDGGSAILDYTATTSGGQSATGTTSPIRVTVPNGTAQTATVTARNTINTGPASAASNSVTPAASVQAIRLSPRSGDLTESATAPWVYTGTGASFGGAIGGIATQALQSGTDGSLSMKSTGSPAGGAGPAEILMGVHAGSTVVGFASLICCFLAEKGFNNYKVFTSGTGVQTSVAYAETDVKRMRRINSSGAANTASIVAEISRDNGSSWVNVYTWNSQPTGVLRFQCTVGTGAGTISNLVGNGLA